jgi:catechol 2,3-dioxygenase-like lactoylglutathione lyase family enzyme
MSTLVPELSVRDLDKSLVFYRDFVGFEVLFERPENRFAYMSYHGSELTSDKHRGEEVP